jgi:hypothetical protein
MIFTSENIGSVLKWLGKPALVLKAVWAFCLLTLWFTRYPAFADAKRTIAPYQGLIQLVLIASSAMLVIFILAEFGTRRRFQKTVHNHLKTLTIPERKVLQFYLHNRTRTAEWALDDSVVGALISRRLLYRDGMGDMRAFPTHINEEVWLQINKHPALIA